MTEPHAADHDLAEQAQTAAGDEPGAAPAPLPVEAPEADAVEQAQAAAPEESVADPDVPLEAEPADATEQAAVVALDEDDYR